MTERPSFKFIEQGAVDKVIGFLNLAKISDYSLEERVNGVHIFINLPPEEIKFRKQHFLNDTTPFSKEKILPFIKFLIENQISYEFGENFVPGEEIEIIILRPNLALNKSTNNRKDLK